MVASPIENTQTPLPYKQADNKVDEDAAGHLGDVAELEPGKSGGLKLNLKRGRYILDCNVVGHHAMGLWYAMPRLPRSTLRGWPAPKLPTRRQKTIHSDTAAKGRARRESRQ